MPLLTKMEKLRGKIAMNKIMYFAEKNAVLVNISQALKYGQTMPNFYPGHELERFLSF